MKAPEARGIHLISGATITAVLLVAAWTVGTTLAERPNLTDEGLTRESTHVIVGKVLGTYKRLHKEFNGRREARYIIEIEVESIEKGEGVTPKDIVYARAWHIERFGIGGATPGPSGHNSIPDTGDRVRAYVAHGPYAPTAQKDRGWAVVYPNGIAILDR